MFDAIRDIILAVAGILVLVVLNRANGNRKRVPSDVWPFILVGFALLLFARILEMSDPDVLTMPAYAKLILQEVVGFVLGFIVLAAGLIRWMSELGSLPRGQAPPNEAGVPDEAQVAAADGQVAKDMLSGVLKSSLSGVMIVRPMRDDTKEIVDFKAVLLNDTAQQILGRSWRNLVGRPILKEFPCIRAENLLGKLVSVLETGLPCEDERRFNQGRNRAWYQYVAVRMGDGLAVTFADVSARKEAEEKLRHAAQHDTLTGLPNRALFSERIAQAINRAKRFSEYKFAVLFLDFDRFKAINDTLGHDAGDQLLIGIADRLRTNLRSADLPSRMEDGHMPARLGGDEFVILLENINDVNDAVAVAERLQRELLVPHALAGHEVVSTASIGIVTSDLGYDTSDDIIRDADVAMYQAKMAGKARYVVFDDEMHREVAARADLERELRQAIDTMPFELSFDPIVELESGRLAGLDAVISWDHPERGCLVGDDFLGLAEEIGVVVPIGEWMLRTACERLRDWGGRFPERTDLAVQVSMTKQQLQHPDMLSTIERILQDTGVTPGAVRLGIPETMLARDVRGLYPDPEVFSHLKELGVELVLNDFGCGQSSLTSLRGFPIDHVAIGRSLTDKVTEQRDYGAIVNAVVELAHNLDKRVIAAGVENPEQVALLQALNCDYAQGSFFSAPVDADACEALLVHEAPFQQAA